VGQTTKPHSHRIALTELSAGSEDRLYNMTRNYTMTSLRTIGLPAFFLVGVVACSTPETTPDTAGQTTSTPQSERSVTVGADPGWKLEPVRAPAAYTSLSPQLTSQAGRIMLSWLELKDSRVTMKFAERTSAGWTAARTVVAGDDLVVNTADVPSVVALSDGTLAAHWLQQDGSDPESYKLPISWSKDSGQTWSPPVYPHHDDKQVQHGFASLFQAPGAGLGVVWLDGRATDGAEGEVGMSLWAAVYSPDGKQLSETSVDPRVCDCCPLSAAATPDGIVVVYRDRSPDEIRDTYATRLEGGRWSTPVAVHNDGWKINGCPVNGPAASARGREVVVAWFTAANDEGKTFVAFSHDGARTFDQPIRVDDGSSLGEVDVELLPDGSSAVTWIESGSPSQSRLRRIESSGARSPSLTLADMSKGRSPRLAQGMGELLVAWPEIDNGAAVIKTSRIALR
jgi:hypothetical protein